MENLKLWTDENGNSSFDFPDFQKVMGEMGKMSGSQMSISQALRIRGRLRTGKLEEAISLLYEENDAMRFVAVPVENDMKIGIIDEYKYHLDMIYAQGATEQEKFEWVRERMKEDNRKPFDITGEPTYRFFVYEISETDHVLLIVCDHTFADGASIILLIKQLLTNYITPSGERTAVKKNAFLDYCKEKCREQRERRDEFTDYWKQHVKGYEPPVLAPVETPDAPDEVRFTVNRKQLEETGKKLRVSPFAISTAALHYAITMFYDRNDTSVSFAVADRFDKRFRDTVGLVLECAVNRAVIDPDEKLTDFIKKVSTVVFENQKYCSYVPVTDPEFRAKLRPPVFAISFENTGAEMNMDKFEEKYGVSFFETNVKRQTQGAFVVHANSRPEDIVFYIQCDDKMWSGDTLRSIAAYMERFLKEADYDRDPAMSEYLSLK